MKIFISCPESVPYEDLLETAKLCRSAGHTVDYWTRMRHSYDSQSIRRADVVVFLLPNNEWSTDIDALPIGVHREMNLALDLNKKLAIAYKSKTAGTMQIYEAKAHQNIIDDIIFTGVASTYGYEKKLTSDKIVNNSYYGYTMDEIDEKEETANYMESVFNPNGFTKSGPAGPIPGKPRPANVEAWLESIDKSAIKVPGTPYTVKGKIEFSSLGKAKLEYDPYLLLMLL